MDVITIKDIAVLCRIGVPEEERAKPQRLLISVQLESDFSEACHTDEISETINYFDVTQRVVEICQAGTFKLVEKLAHDISSALIKEFKPERVTIEVKKFILSNARYVSFTLHRDF